jgi:hypothetical protein
VVASAILFSILFVSFAGIENSPFRYAIQERVITANPTLSIEKTVEFTEKNNEFDPQVLRTFAKFPQQN